MSHYEVVTATRAHAEELAPRMRRADVEECAALGYRPLDALIASVASSAQAFTGLADDKVLCMFGVANEINPWMLASDDLPLHARAFLRVGRAWVASIRRERAMLYNWVGADNTAAVRWLRWLGFTVTDHVSGGLRYFHT